MTTPVDSGTAERRWWLSRDDKAEGPYSEAYLIVSLQKGAIDPEALVCPEGSNQWMPVGKCPPFAEPTGTSTAAGSPELPVRPVGSTAWAGWMAASTNPRLPRMANWICMYCIAVSPALQLLSLLATITFGGTASDLPYDSPIVGYAVAHDVLEFLALLAVTIALVIGALQLCRLKRRGVAILKVAFVLDFARILVTLFFYLVWQAIVALAGPQTAAASSAAFTLRDAATLVALLLLVPVLIAAFVFQVVAFIWLLRHEHELPLESR